MSPLSFPFTRRRLSGGGASILAAALAAAATLAGACGPSYDPALKADIDRRVAALQPGTMVVPPPTGFMPMPLAPGQWAQYKMLANNNESSFFTYKILGEEAGAHWIEVVNETYTGKMIQKMLVAFGDRMDPGQVQIRAVILKDQKGNVTEMPRDMMPMLQSAYRGAVSALIINWQGKPQESLAVPAGRFEGCYRVRSEAQWGAFKSTAESWSHPVVPISGAVRTVGTDHAFVMDLIAFGTTGARSEL